jgi:HAUS augmin-like complex subunit 1
MHRFLDEETQKTQALLGEVGSDSYKPPPDLAKRNLDIQRKIKTTAAGLAELQERPKAAASDPRSNVTVEELAKQEEEYVAMLAEKKELDSQVSFFRGLPHDTDRARSELESLRGDLRRLTRRRHGVFEELVERETPRKYS